jgi:hypothetical protein
MATTTLSADHTPSVRAVTDQDKAYADVFTTALEGGIGYWSVCTRYLWSVDGTLDGQARDFIAVIVETGGEDAKDGDGSPEYVIDRSVIARGIREAKKRGNWATYHARALNDLTFGKWDDLDYDADTADLIVQMGLFGEYRYA